MAMRERRYESMLFNHETTARTDFRNGAISPIVQTEYKPKPICYRIRPRPLKDIQALTDWHRPNVPFDLMHKPKEIVRTNPRVPQKPYTQPEDVLRQEVQKTRPRLVMTPALSMDDIEPNTRKMLLDDIYTTSAMKTWQGSGVEAGRNVRVPRPPLPAPANPITLKRLEAPLVSTEWRMDSVSWDSRQLRTYCDPTKEFWLSRPTRCEVCKQTSERVAMDRIKRSH